MKNSHLFIATCFALAATGATAQTIAPNCDSDDKATQVVAALEQDIETIRAEQNQRKAVLQAQLNEVADKLVASGKWNDAARGDFYKGLLRNERFIDFEQQKKSVYVQYVTVGQAVMTLKEHDKIKEACTGAVEMKRMLTSIGGLNEEQFAFMEKSIKDVETAK